MVSKFVRTKKMFFMKKLFIKQFSTLAKAAPRPPRRQRIAYPKSKPGKPYPRSSLSRNYSIINFFPVGLQGFASGPFGGRPPITITKKKNAYASTKSLLRPRINRLRNFSKAARLLISGFSFLPLVIRGWLFTAAAPGGRGGWSELDGRRNGIARFSKQSENDCNLIYSLSRKDIVHIKQVFN